MSIAAVAMSPKIPWKKACVVGLGATGFSCARYLENLGVQVSVFDSRPRPPFADRLRQEKPSIPFCLGEFDEAEFDFAAAYAHAARHAKLAPKVQSAHKMAKRLLEAKLDAIERAINRKPKKRALSVTKADEKAQTAGERYRDAYAAFMQDRLSCEEASVAARDAELALYKREVDRPSALVPAGKKSKLVRRA